MSLLQQTSTWAITLLLFVGMVLSIWLGMKVRKQLLKNTVQDASAKEGSSDISSLTGLLFFLLAFSFGMSGSRYEARKGVVLEEANAIGTALLRADLYPDEVRTNFRNNFQSYIELRIDYLEAGTDARKVLAADSLSSVVASKIWQQATALAKNPTYLSATQQMIPALNDMMDIATTRLAGERGKVPETIIWMLFILAFASAFFMGYASVGKGKLDWIVASGFCLLISVVVFITLDLDRPRRGLINIESANQTIIDLRKNFR